MNLLESWIKAKQDYQDSLDESPEEKSLLDAEDRAWKALLGAMRPVDKMDPPIGANLLGYDCYYGRVVACRWDGTARFRRGDRPGWQGEIGPIGVPKLAVSSDLGSLAVITLWMEHPKPSETKS